jgi:cytochrome c oxidase cbb3-type subunit 2
MRFNGGFSTVLWIFAVLVPGSARAESSMAQFLASQQLLESGRATFQQNCVGCHGIDATGQGPAAAMLDPKPRNLVSGFFKFRSTPLGTLPTTKDLLRTIDQGIAHSSMPGFPLLTSQQKYALVAYIKSLRADWAKKEGKEFPIPAPPEDVFANRSLFLASAFRGRKLFEEGCLTCHGERGRGDGPGAEGLADVDGHPLRPADLSKPTIKSGRRAQDVYKAVLTGLDGTPMPSFDGIYNEKQIWDLVAYVFFLRGQAAGLYPENLVLDASTLKAEADFRKAKSAPASASSGAGAGDAWE